jgi:hypothetical protein
MLSSTFTSTLRSPVVPSPTLRKSPHQYHSMGLTLPLFSYSYALFCTAERANPFRFIFFRALCGKHPGWGIPSFLATSAHCARPDLIGALKPIRAFAPLAPDRRRSFTEPRKAPNPLRIRTYAKYTRNPFTMNTSKTQHLKPFRMNTYEKTGRGWHRLQSMRRVLFTRAGKQPVPPSLRESLLGRPLPPFISSLPLYVITSPHRCLTASALARAALLTTPCSLLTAAGRLTKPQPSFNVKCLSDT